MNFVGVLHNSIQALVNWIYPSLCLTCNQSVGAPQMVCDKCWNSISKVEKISMNELWLVREKKEDIYFEDFFSCFHFDETIQQIIHALKYEKMTKLAGEIIDKTLLNILENKKITACDLIIPIPLHKKRFKSRGYNQSALLAKELGNHLKIPTVENCLQRIKNTKSQTQLDAEERQQNIKHAFRIKNEHHIRNARILLLDDLITTGVTANECAKVLKDAGAKEIFVFTIARPV